MITLYIKFFFQILKSGPDGNNYLDTSTIIGMTIDSIQLLNYLNQSKALFPNDLEWKITGKLSNNIKCLHAIKSNGLKYTLSENDIDSVIVLLTGLTALGIIGKRISDLKGISQYWIQIKLKKEISDKLKNKKFSLIMNTDSFEYSGSIVNFNLNPNQLIIIGEMDNRDFLKLKEIFEDRMIIE